MPNPNGQYGHRGPARKTVLYEVNHSDGSGRTMLLTVRPSDYGIGVVRTPDYSHEWDILLPAGKTKHGSVRWVPAEGWDAASLIAAGFPPSVDPEAIVPEIVMLARAVLDNQKDVAAMAAFLDKANEAFSNRPGARDIEIRTR